MTRREIWDAFETLWYDRWSLAVARSDIVECFYAGARIRLASWALKQSRYSDGRSSCA